MDKREILISPQGINQKTWRIMFWWRYFSTGYGLTNYIKYVVGVFGLTSQNVQATLILAFMYLILCILVGWAWFQFGLAEIDNEINNRFNLFVREMRNKIK